MSVLISPSPYRRILLKLSGEALMGEQDYGIDFWILEKFVLELKTVAQMGIQIAVVIGGGNIFRGLSGSKKGMDRVSADYMGMLATVINGLALRSSLENAGLSTRLFSAVGMPPICETYNNKEALECLEAGKIVIFSGGTGDPFFTTDTAAALRAAEMKCDVILKGTQVDGVYSSDPKKNHDALRYDTLTYEEVISKNLKVMDLASISLAQDAKIPIVVFSMHSEGALKNVVLEKGLYTRICDR